MSSERKTALLIIDVQNDFCEGGSLGVDGGSAVAQSVTDLVTSENDSGRWSNVVVTRDWHFDPGDHWATDGQDPNFVDTWPVHCQAETDGAAFHPNLRVKSDETFSKGQHGACYSGFEGHADSNQASLETWLRDRDVTDVEIVGIATDHCVQATALDAVTAGFATTVLLQHCAGVAAETTTAALATMADAGVVLVQP